MYLEIRRYYMFLEMDRRLQTGNLLVVFIVDICENVVCALEMIKRSVIRLANTIYILVGLAQGSPRSL